MLPINFGQSDYDPNRHSQPNPPKQMRNDEEIKKGKSRFKGILRIILLLNLFILLTTIGGIEERRQELRDQRKLYK